VHKFFFSVGKLTKMKNSYSFWIFNPELNFIFFPGKLNKIKNTFCSETFKPISYCAEFNIFFRWEPEKKLKIATGSAS
jgi:hypothetical protein